MASRGAASSAASFAEKAAVAMPPVRCFSCGKTLAHMHAWFLTARRTLDTAAPQHFESPSAKSALDELGLTRYCCRRHLLTDLAA